MGASVLVYLLAMSALTIKDDHQVLRSACGETETVIARMRAGSPVHIRFALAGDGGPCYAVSAELDGKSLQGYVSGDALSGLEAWERQRRSASSAESVVLTSPRAKPRQVEDADDLAQAGLASYRRDDLPAALAYWKQSLEIRPSPSVERLYRKAEREAAADTSTQKLYGMRFLLRYDGAVAHPEQARRMAGILDDEFSRLAGQLGCRAEERIVAIAQSRDAYLKTTNAAEWSGGQYDGKIRMAILENDTAGLATRHLLAHEIVHACLANLGQWPAWFHEGLAQKLSGDVLTPAARGRLDMIKRSGALPKLNRLSQDWSRMSAEHAFVAYALALEAVELFFENYKELGLANLIKNPELLPQITLDLDRRLTQ